MIWRLLVWGSLGIFSYNLYLVHNQTKDKPAELETGAIPGFIDVAKSSYSFYEETMEVKCFIIFQLFSFLQNLQ